MNTFGNIFRLTSAGESHGPALTGIIDGMPAGVKIDIDKVNLALSHRRPGGDKTLNSTRREPDQISILSGVLDGVTIGTPIAFQIVNVDARSKDYEHMRHIFRPSHADYTYQAKYGIRDWRGGGRSSARETALRVAAGAMAQAVLDQYGIKIYAYAAQIGTAKIDVPIEDLDLEKIYEHPTRCPHPETAERMTCLLRRTREAGDTIGGIINGVITGLPVGIGEPIYNKFQAMLASAMMSINAAKGFDYGMGFDDACRLGSEMNDLFTLSPDGKITTLTNHSGGIQGGITNGCPVNFRVAFKPVATLMRDCPAISDTGEPVTLHPRGRHDSCVIPRAVSVVQAMAQITTLDALLMSRCNGVM